MNQIDTGDSSLPLFSFAGEFDIGNKIGDVKNHARQEPLPEEVRAELIGRVASRAQRLELLEKIDMALAFLQQAGADRELELEKYLAVFKIKVKGLPLKGLAIKHVVHLYETLEGLVLEELVEETDSRYQVELSENQKQELRVFYK